MVSLTWSERVDELALYHPDAVALSTTAGSGEVVTWLQLAHRSSSVAEKFAHLGVGQGDVVGVELPNCALHVVCTLGAWRLGATVLPLGTNLAPPERQRILELVDPPVVVVSGPPASRAELSSEELLSQRSGGDPARFEPAISDPAWMIASGGSTGAPKLISSRYAAVYRPGGLTDPGKGRPKFIEGGDHRHPVHLVCSPLYHTQGLSLLYHTLLQDFRNVVMARFDAELALDLIETQKVAFMALVPTMLIRLLRSPTIRDRDLSSLEMLTQGAGACPDWVIRSWIDLVGPERFMMGYGSSEGVCSAQIRGEEWLKHPGSVGRPAGTEVRVVDESGVDLPPNEVGELYFRPLDGEHRVRYVGSAELRTIPGGFASIGDLGKVDDEGYMYIADRRTDMVVTGGANVFVSEVESILLKHPAVDDVVVVGLRDPEWGRRVHAIVQPRGGTDEVGLPDLLRAHCKAELAGYKVPKTFEIVADLGRADSGKINRRALAEPREPGL